MRRYYVVRKFINGCCYDSGCYGTIKDARKAIVGSKFSTITRCDRPYEDKLNGWYPEGNCKRIPTGRKCDR